MGPCWSCKGYRSPACGSRRSGFRYGRRAPWVLREVDLTLGPGDVAVRPRPQRRRQVHAAPARSAACCARGGAGSAGGPHRSRWVPERFPAGQPFTVLDYLCDMGGLRGLSTAAANAVDTRMGRTPPPDRLSRRSASAASPRAPRRRSAWPRRCWSHRVCWCSTSPGRASTPVPRRADAGDRRRGDRDRGNGPGQRPLRRDRRPAGRAALAGRRRPGHRRAPRADDSRCVIEVAVASARTADTVAQLRAAGHHILGVRDEALDRAHWTAS